MKLRNKKTGDVFDFDSITDLCFGSKIQFQATNMHNKPIYIFNSLAELNEEWEDYVEPKAYYWVRSEIGDICKTVEGFSPHDEPRKQIGNYFGTEEEAEKAVEKLKAWKRLKDKGFRIALHGCKGNAWLEANWGNLQGDYSDVLLLFGGEE